MAHQFQLPTDVTQGEIEAFWVSKAEQKLEGKNLLAKVRIIPASEPESKDPAVQAAETELGEEYLKWVKVLSGAPETPKVGRKTSAGAKKGGTRKTYPCYHNYHFFKKESDWCPKSGAGRTSPYCTDHVSEKKKTDDASVWKDSLDEAEEKGTQVREGKGFSMKGVQGTTAAFVKTLK